jgi:hypothetical protein
MEKKYEDGVPGGTGIVRFFNGIYTTLASAVQAKMDQLEKEAALEEKMRKEHEQLVQYESSSDDDLGSSFENDYYVGVGGVYGTGSTAPHTYVDDGLFAEMESEDYHGDEWGTMSDTEKMDHSIMQCIDYNRITWDAPGKIDSAAFYQRAARIESLEYDEMRTTLVFPMTNPFSWVLEMCNTMSVPGVYGGKDYYPFPHSGVSAWWIKCAVRAANHMRDVAPSGVKAALLERSDEECVAEGSLSNGKQEDKSDIAPLEEMRTVHHASDTDMISIVISDSTIINQPTEGAIKAIYTHAYQFARMEDYAFPTKRHFFFHMFPLESSGVYLWFMGKGHPYVEIMQVTKLEDESVYHEVYQGELVVYSDDVLMERLLGEVVFPALDRLGLKYELDARVYVQQDLMNNSTQPTVSFSTTTALETRHPIGIRQRSSIV